MCILAPNPQNPICGLSVASDDSGAFRKASLVAARAPSIDGRASFVIGIVDTGCGSGLLLSS